MPEAHPSCRCPEAAPKGQGLSVKACVWTELSEGDSHFSARPILSPSALTQGHPLSLRWEHSRKGPKILMAAASPAPQARTSAPGCRGRTPSSHLLGSVPGFSANTLLSPPAVNMAPLLVTHLKSRKQTAQGDKPEGRASIPSCSPCHSRQDPHPHPLWMPEQHTACRARASHGLPPLGKRGRPGALAPEAGRSPPFPCTGQGFRQGTQSSRSQPGTEGPLPGGLGQVREG